MKKISELCKFTRESFNLSARAFAKQRGVSNTYIKKIEDGEYDDNPTALTLSNIFKVLQFDISMFEAISGINRTNEFKDEFIRQYNKGYKGTAEVNNAYNILKMFKEEYLEKNGYEGIEIIDKTELIKKDVKEKKWNLSVPDMTCLLKDKKALNGYKEVYIFLIDIVSTIKTSVDENKIDDIIGRSFYSLITDDDYDDGENVFIYLTSSDKIYNYINKKYSSVLHNISGKNNRSNEFYVSLCRPKREIKKPIKLY